MATSRVTEYFSRPVERVWQVVTDLSHTAWRSDLAQVEVLDETHFVEHTKSGYATNFTVTACEPLRHWAFTMENGNMSGSWEGIFEAAEGGGTQLHCTETVYAKHWWMRPFVPGYLKQQQMIAHTYPCKEASICARILEPSSGPIPSRSLSWRLMMKTAPPTP